MSDGAVAADSAGDAVGSPEPPWLDVDVAVIGSGAAGLSAAITAATHGARVAVFEKHERLGGTSAWCGGWMWIPGNGVAEPGGPRPATTRDAGAVAVEAARADDSAAARDYLRAELKADYSGQATKIDAYLKGGRAMLAFFAEEHARELAFELDTATPEFHALPGQRVGGRMVRASAFDGRLLGAAIESFRRPLHELTVFGLAIESGHDLDQFLNALRSLGAALYVIRRVLRYARDLVCHGRDMHLVNGNALVARLVACALRLEREAVRPTDTAGSRSPPSVDAPACRRLGLFASHDVRAVARELGSEGGRESEDERSFLLDVEAPGRARHWVRARSVVLAGGGFPHDIRRIGRLFPPPLRQCGHRSVAPIENTGDGLRLGEGMGGRVGPTLRFAAAWAPVSVLRRRDGASAVYPHFVERAKPGLIAVLSSGTRFVDEAVGYVDFVDRWLEASAGALRLEAWLVCDRCFIWRYGLGAVKPGGLGLMGALATGYVKLGWTVARLAVACGIDADGLRRTLVDYNGPAAQRSSDPLFRRGESAYDRSQGDPLMQPNPCVAPITHAPYFALRLQPGSLGTLAGLATDAEARVLDGSGAPITGLYACGNDMAGVMGGYYPANGTTLAAAMTFGHLAGNDAARRARARPASAVPS